MSESTLRDEAHLLSGDIALYTSERALTGLSKRRLQASRIPAIRRALGFRCSSVDFPQKVGIAFSKLKFELDESQLSRGSEGTDRDILVVNRPDYRNNIFEHLHPLSSNASRARSRSDAELRLS